MGFLDFLFKSKEEMPNFGTKNNQLKPNTDRTHNQVPPPVGVGKSSFKVEIEDNFYKSGIDPLPRTYSDKGVTTAGGSNKNPWRAYLSFSRKDSETNKFKTYNVHIGQYKTKEEAQKARWEFIENLK